jgi:hypothetical protein
VRSSPTMSLISRLGVGQAWADRERYLSRERPVPHIWEKGTQMTPAVADASAIACHPDLAAAALFQPALSNSIDGEAEPLAPWHTEEPF